jgi:SAM-dependent methyltransferase
MVSVLDHYESHLAPVYAWMAGGVDSALERGRAEVAAACPRPQPNQLAVDLGAGFGMHSIALAELGYSVVAVDSSRILLEELRARSGALPIRALGGNLLEFRQHIESSPSLVLCMGDTLTHLESRATVGSLFAGIFDALAEGGRFITTFRDYSVALEGTKRFIPVRSDAERILTCFLEYQEATVTVHDIIHERLESGWQQRVSAYRKLRLPVDWVIGALETQGFQVRQDTGPAGMIRLIAERRLCAAG